MNTVQIIRDKLEVLSTNNYKSGGLTFKDEAHFKDSLERCYALIANRTCQQWNKILGKGIIMTSGEFRWHCWTDDFELPFSPIHSDDFEGLFKSFRVSGKKRKVRYSALLSILEQGGIVEVNNSYSNGVDDGQHYPKSYRLSSQFVIEIVAAYLDGKPQGEAFNVFDCFNGYYPNKLLEKKLARAKILYAETIKQDGVSVVLPDGWDKMLSLFGWFEFDEKLDIDSLVRGLQFFKRHETYGYVGGRFYDWFTACSSAFRKYLWKDGKRYRELVDCHSGFFWMFALYGYQEGKIGREECQRMIDHCFGGRFYEDVSGLKKTRAVKTEFMKVLNMTVRQVQFMQKDGLFCRIKDGLSKAYPEWFSFLEALRSNPKMRKNEKIGRFNHFTVIEIERRIMDELRDRLERIGFSDLKRVHDALWGIDEIGADVITKMLYNVVMDYFNSIVHYRIAA